jgi:hypothetical protein
MKCEVKSVERFAPVSGKKIPNGNYPGLWSAYEVKFDVEGEPYRATTTMGVRGINQKCTVIVHNGSVTVEAR